MTLGNKTTAQSTELLSKGIALRAAKLGRVTAPELTASPTTQQYERANGVEVGGLNDGRNALVELQAMPSAVGRSSIAYIQRGIHQPLTLGHAAQQGADEVHDAYAVLATPDFRDCAFRIGGFTNKKRPKPTWFERPTPP